jgi:CRP-like cAMP-binding protein
MLTTVEKVLFLMRAPVTADATTDALSRLAMLAPEVEIALGQKLFSAGDTPDAMYVILDGAVRVDGAEAGSRLAGPGEVVGGVALFGPGPHLASATAVVTTRVLKIERADLQDLCDEDGEFARALFGGLVRALHATAPAAMVA